VIVSNHLEGKGDYMYELVMVLVGLACISILIDAGWLIPMLIGAAIYFGGGLVLVVTGLSISIFRDNWDWIKTMGLALIFSGSVLALLYFAWERFIDWQESKDKI
jgi:multidrug transporter EmrE-like cation transporter